MKILCTNKSIVSLVTNEDNHSVPAHDLAYKYIYPYEWLPDTIDTGHTFICFDVDIIEVPNRTMLVPYLYIWVFTHKSLLRLREGGARLDLIANEIDNELNGNRLFGLGQLQLNQVTRFVPISNYQGRMLTYRTRDFNYPKNTAPPPSNRRDRI